MLSSSIESGTLHIEIAKEICFKILMNFYVKYTLINYAQFSCVKGTVWSKLTPKTSFLRLFSQLLFKETGLEWYVRFLSENEHISKRWKLKKKKCSRDFLKLYFFQIKWYSKKVLLSRFQLNKYLHLKNLFGMQQKEIIFCQWSKYIRKYIQIRNSLHGNLPNPIMGTKMHREISIFYNFLLYMGVKCVKMKPIHYL